MKISFWNIRGLNYPNKQVAIRNFVFVNKIDVMAVLETKVKENKSLSVRKKICSHGSWVDNGMNEFSGRVWLWWTTQRINMVVL